MKDQDENEDDVDDNKNNVLKYILYIRFTGLNWKRKKLGGGDFCHGLDLKDRPRPSGTFFLVVLVVVVEFQAVTRGENKLPCDYYTLDPRDFLQILNPL